jgi:hypothetical protein
MDHESVWQTRTYEAISPARRDVPGVEADAEPRITQFFDDPYESPRIPRECIMIFDCNADVPASGLIEDGADGLRALVEGGFRPSSRPRENPHNGALE